MGTRTGFFLAVVTALTASGLAAAGAPEPIAAAASRPHDTVELVALYKEGENHAGEPLELDLLCHLQELPQDDGFAEARADIKVFLPHKMRIHGRMRRVEVGQGAQDPCHETGLGDEDVGYYPFRAAIDYTPQVADRGVSGRRTYVRIDSALRRAKELTVAVDMEHDGYHTHIRRNVPIRGWTASCWPKRVGLVKYDSYSPDPYNRPPTATVRASDPAANRCVLEVGANGRDPEGDWVSNDWSVDGQLVQHNPPDDPDADEGPYAEKPLVRTFPLDNKRHTISVKVYDKQGAWRSGNFQIQPHSTRIKDWPYG